MHRAKHRADGDGAGVLATTLIERCSAAPAGVATLPPTGAPTPDVDGTDLYSTDLYGPALYGTDLYGTGSGGPALFGSAPRTGPFLAVGADDEGPARDAATLFGGAHDVVPHQRTGESPLFGAARHAARNTRPAGRDATTPDVPAPRVPALPFDVSSLTSRSLGLPAVRMRPQPVGAALTVTVLGAAAAVTGVGAPPPSPVETTGSLAPVQNAAPAPAPAVLAAPELAVPAPAALPEQPTVQVADLVRGVTGEMEKLTPTVEARVETVASSKALSSPAAMRKAAVSKALSKLGTPYRWGAMGPNAFDCSGLVKWSFKSAGKDLPRTSRAMAGAGTPVSKANLQPGDLVFFYKPISHVGIYIGNGKIVHASRKGQPVKVSDMARMKFTKAVRV